MKKLSLYWLTLFITLAAPLAFAKPVNLYEQPMVNAKVVGTVDSGSSLVPIFTNKAGDWMKVGDPHNGNVGWVKLSDFSNTNKAGGVTSSGFSMTERTIDTAQGPQTYRTVQFGGPQLVTPTNLNDPKYQQTRDILKRVQAEQLQMQRNSQQILDNIYRDMNLLYQNSGNTGAYPVFMPVIFVPTPMDSPLAPQALPAKPTAPPKPPKPAP